jgi:iron complex transport system substrate-binding protein
LVSPFVNNRVRIAALILVAVLAACTTETADSVAQVDEVDQVENIAGDSAESADDPDEDAVDPPEAESPTANVVDGCADPEMADADLEWFPEQVSFDVASGIRVEYEGNTKLVTIDRPTDDPDVDPLTLALVQCGTSTDGVDADLVVEVPVDAVATYSTTFLQGFELIGREDVLVAHGGTSFVSSDTIRTLIDDGSIVEVGNSSEPDLEVLAAAEPDLVMVSAGFGGVDPTEGFAALDVPVLPNASFLEQDPLGRAEWMKLEAMLLNEEAAVDEVFETIAADYRELTELVADVDERPTVLTGSPFEGSWFIATGDSYTSALIEAAGGTYLFDDLEGPTQPLDLEVVLDRAQDADVWLNAGSVAEEPDALLGDDERLGQFTAFPDRVFPNDADLGPTGGNRFFEEGAVRPDLVLADVVSMLHPDLLPDHELRFYGLIGSQAGTGAQAGNSG